LARAPTDCETFTTSLMEGVNKVNGVAGALSSKRELLQSSHSAFCGPNKVQLPLDRDAHKLAFTLEHILSPAECERLIQAAEEEGFGIAGLGSTGSQVVATEFRNSSRLIVDDPFLAQQIFERIQPYLPTVWEGRRLIGLNEQLKFLRYHPGQKFVAHFDGAFCRPNTSNQTCLTVQLYLSQGQMVGGATRFMGADAQPAVCCTPDAGRVLVFQHNILHDGEEVKEGVKYTIRTDVEYSDRHCSAELQELVGLGGSPIDRRRRCLRLLPVLIVVFAAVWSQC